MWKRISFKNRTWTERLFSWKFVSRNRNSINCKRSWKVVWNGENVREGEGEDDRLRMFKLLLPLIDQGEIDVSQSRNVLVF